MRIVDYELFEVPPRWVFLKIETNEGIAGWGEPVVAGRARATMAAVEEIMDTYLLGKDPFPIEDHWQMMYRGGFFRGGPILMCAIAGIDQALWDIKGRALDVPIYELLGGKTRDTLRMYQWIGGDDPSDVGEAAAEKIDEGFTALKMNATGKLRRIDNPDRIERARARLAEVRDTIGSDADIAVDFHGRVAKSQAKRLAEALDPYDPMWIEEPVLPEHNRALQHIAEHTSAPIATGERMYSRFDFAEMLEDGVVDVVQPDASTAGGITEVKKIADMAETYDVALAPHSPLGPIALAACVQIDACSPNATIQEQSLNIHYNEGSNMLDYLENPSVFKYDDGYMPIPDSPGLGIEINETAVEDAAGAEVDWHNPVWRYEDGSVGEW